MSSVPREKKLGLKMCMPLLGNVLDDDWGLFGDDTNNQQRDHLLYY